MGLISEEFLHILVMPSQRPITAPFHGPEGTQYNRPFWCWYIDDVLCRWSQTGGRVFKLCQLFTFFFGWVFEHFNHVPIKNRYWHQVMWKINWPGLFWQWWTCSPVYMWRLCTIQCQQGWRHGCKQPRCHAVSLHIDRVTSPGYWGWGAAQSTLKACVEDDSICWACI